TGWEDNDIIKPIVFIMIPSNLKITQNKKVIHYDYSI
ncbi:hypothetical protein Q604_UNBC02141G0002, partial [human gut metagenome]